MIRQFNNAANYDFSLFFGWKCAKFDSILIVNSHRLQPGLVTNKFFIVQGTIPQKVSRILHTFNQIDCIDIFFYNLRLKAMLFLPESPL